MWGVPVAWLGRRTVPNVRFTVPNVRFTVPKARFAVPKLTKNPFVENRLYIKIYKLEFSCFNLSNLVIRLLLFDITLHKL